MEKTKIEPFQKGVNQENLQGKFFLLKNFEKQFFSKSFLKTKK
jgi:hypothetical protein